MKIIAFIIAFTAASAFAESANIRVSPFSAQIGLGNEIVKVDSAELILSTNFCFIAPSCQSGSDKSKTVALAIIQNNEVLSLSLKKKAELNSWRPLPYNLQSCSLLIILRARDKNGKKVIGRLDPGSIGGSADECNDQTRTDNFLNDYLNRSPEVTWVPAQEAL